MIALSPLVCQVGFAVSSGTNGLLEGNIAMTQEAKLQALRLAAQSAADRIQMRAEADLKLVAMLRAAIALSK